MKIFAPILFFLSASPTFYLPYPPGLGRQAEVIVWSYGSLSRYGSHSLHKVKVEAVAFSPNDVFMASLGGQDDGNVIVYDMATKDPLCGTRGPWGLIGFVESVDGIGKYPE